MPGMPVALSTPRLVARLPREDDAVSMLALYGAPEVAERLYPDARPRTEAELWAMVQGDLAHWRAHGFGRLYWDDADTGELVARCGPRLAVAGGRPEIDLHWAVRADRHRQGLAREAAAAVVEACFASLEAESVTAIVRFDNPASEGVARALGFAYERDVERHGAPHRLYRRRRDA